MVLADLKATIERLEGRTKHFSGVRAGNERAWTLGLETLDKALPENEYGQTGLGFDACHDFTPITKTDVPHVAGFIFSLLKRLPRDRLDRRPLVWCQTAFNAREYGRIYAPGLIGSGLEPQNFLFVNVPKERDLALVLEECVRVAGVAAVVGEGAAPDFTASRRLTLAAQKSRVPCLILNTSGAVGASAASTRWRVAPIAGPPDPYDEHAPGQPAWSLTLARARGGNAALNPTLASALKVIWNDETHSFDLASAFFTGKSLAAKGAHRAL